MDPNAINTVVDNLATKIGIAADRIQPIADTMVQEAARSHMFVGFACVAVWVIVVCILSAILFFTFKGTDADSEDDVRTVVCVCSFIVFLIATIACSINAVSSFATALRPVTTVVEKFLH